MSLKDNYIYSEATELLRTEQKSNFIELLFGFP